MVLLSINFAIIVLWVYVIRKDERGDIADYVGGLIIVSLILLGFNLLYPYKEIRREPIKFVQVEWNNQKYEGLSPLSLRKVEAFTPEPHFQIIHSSLFGVKLPPEKP